MIVLLVINNIYGIYYGGTFTYQTTTKTQSPQTGDMYKGEWRDCQIAVKCLNPVMLGLQFNSRSTWIDFLHDANKIGALRHPNLVEVYGIVLPSDPRIAALNSGVGGQPPGRLSSGSRRASVDYNYLAIGGGGNFMSDAQQQAWASTLPQSGPQKLPGMIQQTPAMVMEYVAARSLR